MARNPIAVREAGAGDWRRGKDIRIRMLECDPDAYGGTLEEALGRPKSYWKERAAASADGTSQKTFAATAGRLWVGIVTCFIQEESPTDGYIVGMWVDPGWRKQGVGRSLLEAASEWSRRKGLKSVRLHVNEAIQPARRLYESLGFEYTGRSNPMDRDQSINLIEMRLSLD